MASNTLQGRVLDYSGAAAGSNLTVSEESDLTGAIPALAPVVLTLDGSGKFSGAVDPKMFRAGLVVEGWSGRSYYLHIQGDLPATVELAEIAPSTPPGGIYPWQILPYAGAIGDYTPAAHATDHTNPHVVTAAQVGLGSGLLVTITTAKLTGGGANGSQTFTNGVLTAQTAAT